MLIQRGANVNVTDEDGEAPLHVAAKNGFCDVVALLVDPQLSIKDASKPLIRANLECKEKVFGWTPLVFAGTAKHQMIPLLIVFHLRHS